MTVLKETIKVRRPVREAFNYIADFTTTAEWDSTAQRAEQLTDGPIAVGTEFLVTCALPLGSVDLHYTITALEQDRRIELAGTCSLFDVRDTISFESRGDQTEITYQAEFSFRALLKPLVPAMGPGLDRMGKASVAGLKAALDDDFAPPDTDRVPTDRLPLSRVARFTRFGYLHSKKHFKPMSADVSGRHMVITGASSGLGFAAAKELARRGARLTLVMRDRAKAKAVCESLRAETGNGAIRTEIADLSLMGDVDKLVARLLRRKQPIDVLVNNAGALFGEYGETKEGLERSLALLLLSPWRLTLGLKPLLDLSGDARVINVVSGGMYTQPLSMAHLVARPDEAFNGAVAYARAKRALTVVTTEWASDWADEGISVNAMHPGWADTPGVESALPRFHTLTRSVLRSPEEGADTIVWLAIATEAGQVSGELFMDREVQPQHLLASTRERPGEREQLMDYLDAFKPGSQVAATA